MKYRRRDAKAYAREHFKGIWAAALTPFTPDLAIDEAGLRRNLRHWVDDLGIDGVFVSRQAGRVLLDVGRRAQAHLRHRGRGARRPSHDPVVLGPEHGRGHRSRQARAGDRRRLHRRACAGAAFPARAGRDALRILPRHQRAGGDRHRAVEPSRQRLSDEPGAVRPHRRHSRTWSRSSTACRARCMRGSRGSPATGSWSAPPPRRNGSTTSSSSAGSSISARRRPISCRPRSTGACANTPTSPCAARSARAKAVRDSLDPVREALKRTRPAEKFHAHSKYWQELLGQAGGAVRRPHAGADRGREGRDPPRLRELRARSSPQPVRSSAA